MDDAPRSHGHLIISRSSCVNHAADRAKLPSCSPESFAPPAATSASRPHRSPASSSAANANTARSSKPDRQQGRRSSRGKSRPQSVPPSSATLRPPRPLEHRMVIYRKTDPNGPPQASWAAPPPRKAARWSRLEVAAAGRQWSRCSSVPDAPLGPLGQGSGITLFGGRRGAAPWRMPLSPTAAAPTPQA